jgi:polyisoprenoid-binding protein YceI
MKRIAIAALVLLSACAQPATETSPVETAVVHDAPAGDYRLDAAHADLSFRVNHIGFSMYTARFARWDATLQFDPANPEAMNVSAAIDVSSLTLPSPPAGFTEEMLGPNWFDAAQFPQMTFQSTAVEQTGPNTARLTGDLTLRGITKPVTLDVRFNGGYAGHPMDPNGRIGFSARGTLKRSDFGIAYGIPPEGSTMGVFDEVEFAIETEFTGPPLANVLPFSP